VREEKFIATNEVVSTTITANRPVTLEVNGRSWTPGRTDGQGGLGRVASFDAACTHIPSSNAIKVEERGRMFASVTGGYGRTQRLVEGPFVLDGMTSVLTASTQMQNVTVGNYTEVWADTNQPQTGVCI